MKNFKNTYGGGWVFYKSFRLIVRYPQQQESYPQAMSDSVKLAKSPRISSNVFICSGFEG